MLKGTLAASTLVVALSLAAPAHAAGRDSSVVPPSRSALAQEVAVAVVGGGVVGCAVASALARTNRSVLLLEGGPRLGDGVTSRNSGVIHSGLYYPPQSLKARACVRGNDLLYEWAAARGVPHARPGKLVIARDAADVPDLEALEANARAS